MGKAFTDDEKLIRKSFITLRESAEKLQKTYTMFNLKELSMGMSADYSRSDNPHNRYRDLRSIRSYMYQI